MLNSYFAGANRPKKNYEVKCYKIKFIPFDYPSATYFRKIKLMSSSF